jgi:hypothetical protein
MAISSRCKVEQGTPYNATFSLRAGIQSRGVNLNGLILIELFRLVSCTFEGFFYPEISDNYSVEYRKISNESCG